MSRLLAAAAIMLICGIAVSNAQYGTGRALLAYPMQGQTLEQENADRSACHDWAVAQTGVRSHTRVCSPAILDKPSAGTGASYEHPRYPHQSGGFVGAMGNAERRRLNERYDAYLRAGQGLFGKIGASNANLNL